MKLPPFFRHSFCALSGAFALHSQALHSFLIAAFVYGVCVLWSVLEKGSDLPSDARQRLKMLTGAAASQMLSLLAGILAARDGEVSAPSVTAFGLANVLSQVRPGQALACLAALCMLPLAACSNLERDEFLASLRVTAETIARETSVTGAEILLERLKAEHAALKAKPVDADEVQRVADAARVKSLELLIQQGEQRLAQLKAANAERLLKLQSSGKNPVASVRPVKRWRRVSIPILAPSVVSSLRASPAL
jgi:hypothetical protein